MPVMQRVVKPKTQRAKRALIEREPKVIENTKTAMLLRGSNASDKVVKCMKNLTALKKPNAVYFGRKNQLLPFEDQNPLEAFSKQHDASLFMFGSHNKKRPHNLVIGRMYDYHVLDMVELGIESFKSLEEIKAQKVGLGTKPFLIFAGEQFTEDEDYKRLKNLLIDFFRGPVTENLSLTGLEHVLMFTVVKGIIHFRSYRIVMKKSGTKVPRIELDEMGPSIDLVMRRKNFASPSYFKVATKRPKEVVVKKKKNIKHDKLGTKLGRVHMQRLDMTKFQTRKLKGLRKTKPGKKGEKGKMDSGRKRKTDAGGQKKSKGKRRKQNQ